MLDANKLALNIEKKKQLSIVSLCSEKDYEINCLKVWMQKITRANHVKFLGVLLDETLSWKFNLIELSRKLPRSVGIFLQIEAFSSKRNAKTIYYSLFYIFSFYSIVVWHATHENYLKPVFISQKKL